MARFKVEVTQSQSRTFEVEAETRSDAMDQWYDNLDSFNDPPGWFLVGESEGEEECYIVRELD